MTEHAEVEPKNAGLSKRIAAAVDGLREPLLDLLRDLVRAPSVTGAESDAQAVVERHMRTMDLETDVWEPDPVELAPYAEAIGVFETFAGRPNVVGTQRGSGGGRSLILNGHIDTVTPGDLTRWTHPPYAADIADNRLFGRGACDMKAGLATNLVALMALRAAGYTPCGDVIVQSVISEEDGGAGTIAALVRGYTADAAIITEPTQLAIITAQGGSLVFALHVPGRTAHACVRNEGESAIEAFAYLHAMLRDLETTRNATLDHPLYTTIANKIPINIGTIRGGDWPSSVPEWLIAEGRAGLVPGEDVDAFRSQFIAVIDHAAQAHPWLRDHPPRVEWFSGQFAPSEIPASSPLVQTIARAHATVTGQEAKIEGATYGADMRHFLHTGGIPCLMYGAGNVRLAHFTDES
ncbi:MAG: ArgE/DapE family deacylase, partial [Chloroflexota bacterium]|nr:ArgE/DapE family deacylase [Chloroflexota bacterium]